MSGEKLLSRHQNNFFQFRFDSLFRLSDQKPNLTTAKLWYYVCDCTLLLEILTLYCFAFCSMRKDLLRRGKQIRQFFSVAIFGFTLVAQRRNSVQPSELLCQMLNGVQPAEKWRDFFPWKMVKQKLERKQSPREKAEHYHITGEHLFVY